MPLHEFSDFEDSDARNNINDFSIEVFSTSVNLSVEMFMDELKPVVLGTFFFHRDE